MTTRFARLTGIAAVLVAAALFGAIALNTATAQVVEVGTVVAPPTGFPPRPAWEREPEAPAENAGGDLNLGDLEAISCSLTDGCRIPVAITTDEGEVLKLMVITFEDMPESEDPEPTPTPVE